MTIDNLDRVIRTMLISQSELPARFVRNASSAYGTDLDKRLLDEVFDSIETDDVLMLFDNNVDAQDDNVSMTESNDDLTYYLTFKTTVTLYGDRSADVAVKTIARLRSELVRLKLQSNDVFVKDVTNPVVLREFKNNVLWTRHSFELSYAVKLTINSVEESYDVQTIDVTVIPLDETT